VTDEDGADWRSGSGARSVCTGEGCGREGSAEAIRAGRGASADGARDPFPDASAGLVAIWLADEATVACVRGWRRWGVGATAAGWSAARVTVPFRLKLWRSLGPIASVAGVSLPLGGACWASAIAGVSASTPASNAFPKRETALICSRSAR
jgi:hypothetical protein